jgi:hypothetical protein
MHADRVMGNQCWIYMIYDMVIGNSVSISIVDMLVITTIGRRESGRGRISSSLLLLVFGVGGATAAFEAFEAWGGMER